MWHGDLRGAPVWTAINSNLGSTTTAWGNLEIQYPLQWGWTGSRAGGTAVELRLVDLLPGSGTYGQIVGQTNGLDAAIGPVGSWGLSPDGRFVAAASAWNGSLAIVDADPASSTYLQILTSTPIPASTSAPGFTVNNNVVWAPDSERVYIARQNQNTNPGEIACYDRTTGWVDFDPSTPWFVDHIGANPVPAVTLPPGVRRIAIAPTGDALYAAGSALGGGFVGRIELPSLAFSYGNGTTWMRHVTHLALTPDGDTLAACVPGTIVLYDTATMAEAGSQALGSGVEIDDLRWR
ncbi:MAG: hypothetical protein NXI31_14520 [bacterium]|nr:hypothetical protein [bacterium]